MSPIWSYVLDTALEDAWCNVDDPDDHLEAVRCHIEVLENPTVKVPDVKVRRYEEEW